MSRRVAKDSERCSALAPVVQLAWRVQRDLDRPGAMVGSESIVKRRMPRLLNMAGENDVVGAQSRRSGSGILVAKHQPCSVYFASIAFGSQRRSKDKNKNEQSKVARQYLPLLASSW